METWASIARLSIRKMCCLNGSRKLHFVQKNRLGRIINYLGPEVFFAHLRNFLQVLDLHIFRQKQPGHWAEVVCHFHLLLKILKFLKIRIGTFSFCGFRAFCVPFPGPASFPLRFPPIIPDRNDKTRRLRSCLSPIPPSVATSPSETRRKTCMRAENTLPLQCENENQ